MRDTSQITPFRFLIHGWNGDFTSGINNRLRRAYHQLADRPFNVIVVDWSPTSKLINYAAVRKLVPAIGQAIGDFIASMRTHTGLSPDRTQLIGHSLGAHIAGAAGKAVQRCDGQRLAAIVGLDPARPLFDIGRPAERLAAGDARYVETIHTNRGQQGFSRPIGDAAFYPNWGSAQPGCGRDLLGTCSHARAVRFLEESVARPDGRWFRATRCAYAYEEIRRQTCTSTGWAEMGGEPLLAVGSPKSAVGGVYFVATLEQSPYAMEQLWHGVTVDSGGAKRAPAPMNVSSSWMY